MNLKAKFYKQQKIRNTPPPPHKGFAIGFGILCLSLTIAFAVGFAEKQSALSAIVAGFLLSLIVTAGLAFYLWLAFIPSIMGEKKGYDFWAIFALAVFISWPLALIVVLILEDNNDIRREEAKRFDCPECGESISLSARSCRFCAAIITDKDKGIKVFGIDKK